MLYLYLLVKFDLWLVIRWCLVCLFIVYIDSFVSVGLWCLRLDLLFSVFVFGWVLFAGGMEACLRLVVTTFV